MIRYPITIFLSAFLLFQVQPLVGKVILPWFGGSPAVWTACMLFFQTLLLGGYAYAHLVSTALPAKALAALHMLLLVVSLAFLPISAAESWKPTGSELPVLRILGLLIFTVGLPYFLLSTTGPLLQESFRRETGRTPYRLYALSNVGSLLALLSYPFVFEPQLSLRVQTLLWSGGYALFVALGLWSAVRFARLWRPSVALEPAHDPDWQPTPRPPLSTVALWLALAACGSVMLLATTNQLCQDVTSVPFLWVVPLSIYLLTFIICFEHDRWYVRKPMMFLLAAAVAMSCWALFFGNDLEVPAALAIYSLALFVYCMICHGELARSRPAAEHATLFYLMVAAGGALGGVLVAIVAPLVFNGYWEYPIAMLVTVGLAYLASQRPDQSAIELPTPTVVVGGSVIVALFLAMGVVVGRQGWASESVLAATRNFYGVLRVDRGESKVVENGPVHELIHGNIQHGFQFQDDDKRRWPTTYYGRESGVGLAIERHPRRQAEQPADRTLRIGVVGLGTGTIAAYGERGDAVRFYEINPDVIHLSNEYFSFLSDTPAEVEVVLGDARINLERELEEGDIDKFDVLAIDAFSSDSIPMHLLTKEAVELYRNRLKPDGILCIHISNRFLDLAGVVLGISRALDYPALMINSEKNEAIGVNRATWIILTKNESFLNDPEVRKHANSDWTEKARPIVWTDDYGSLWQVLDR